MSNSKINRNFQNNKIPKESVRCVCLSVILLDSIVQMNENYNLQIFLEECTYAVKVKEMKNFIDEELKLVSFVDESDDECDNKSNK